MSSPPFRILVALDFSPEAGRALRTARDLARRTSAETTILHVRPLSDIRAAIQEGREDLLQGTTAALRSALEEHFAKRFAALARKNERPLLLRGHPAREICREVRRGAYNLVVMGSRGRGRVASALLGSTAQEVLSQSRVSVLVAR
jgi:nucleotide-binding universal stress UspA family protein